MLAAGADKDKVDIDERTPLQFAATAGKLAVVHCLLDAGADKEKATLNLCQTYLFKAPLRFSSCFMFAFPSGFPLRFFPPTERYGARGFQRVPEGSRGFQRVPELLGIQAYFVFLAFL